MGIYTYVTFPGLVKNLAFRYIKEKNKLYSALIQILHIILRMLHPFFKVHEIQQFININIFK